MHIHTYVCMFEPSPAHQKDRSEKFIKSSVLIYTWFIKCKLSHFSFQKNENQAKLSDTFHLRTGHKLIAAPFFFLASFRLAIQLYLGVVPPCDLLAGQICLLRAPKTAQDITVSRIIGQSEQMRQLTKKDKDHISNNKQQPASKLMLQY